MVDLAFNLLLIHRCSQISKYSTSDAAFSEPVLLSKFTTGACTLFEFFALFSYHIGRLIKSQLSMFTAA